MFKTLINNTVESVQAMQKIAIDSFVKHEPLANSFNKFVDAQTVYTKNAVTAMSEAGSSLFQLITDKDFYTDLVNTAQESVKTVLPKKEKQND